MTVQKLDIHDYKPYLSDKAVGMIVEESIGRIDVYELQKQYL
ncbi:hypothetical protein [Dysgonomonas sp. 521]|nr:hypothetical protein [Dysgonomonas sp. 521]